MWPDAAGELNALAFVVDRAWEQHTVVTGEERTPATHARDEDLLAVSVIGRGEAVAPAEAEPEAAAPAEAERASAAPAAVEEGSVAPPSSSYSSSASSTSDSDSS